VPLYYFEPEGWDYQDVDGIELLSDAEALAYAHAIIRELKEDVDGERIVRMLVKNALGEIIFSIPFK
jgi:Domain of unknown function (DUF6894)